MFSPIGIKTDYSLMKSLVKLDDLINYAKDNNISCIGILEDNLSSSNVFVRQCIKNNIKPIFGLDLYINDINIYLYPQNNEALKNLFKLSVKELTNIEELKEFNKDIICVIPNYQEDIYQQLSKIYSNLFLSYKNDIEKDKIKKITDSIIYINKIYCLNKEDAPFVNYLSFIKDRNTLGSKEMVDYSNNVIELKEEDTSQFINLINLTIFKNDKYIPTYTVDSYNTLKNIANKGLSKRLNNNISDEYQQRLDEELKTIHDMGYDDYFLICYDYVLYAKKNNILVGLGRGSAVGSIVAYSLGITWVDPIKYNLLFERFLNSQRTSMPDIDIDIEDLRRDEVVDYIIDKYGSDKVAKIISYGTMASKEVIRAVGFINGVDDNVLSRLTNLINPNVSLKENLNTNNKIEELLSKNNKLNKVYNDAYHLEGIKRNTMTHPAGVVISSVDLIDVVPLIKVNDKNLIYYTKDELEDLGLLKMDLLAVTDLSIMHNIIESIDKNININEIDLNDSNVYKVFSTGNTMGIFQFKKADITKFLVDLKPNSFQDIVITNAINRPGTKTYKDTFIERKNKNKKYFIINDTVNNILKDTYGMLLYEEQVMEILRVMGDFSYSDADIIRRYIKKGDIAKVQEYKEKFMNNAILKYSEKECIETFDLITKYAGFGFNKSHAVAYAMISFQMAYLKYYYPLEFYISSLNRASSSIKPFIDEVRKRHIGILPPDINLSFVDFAVEDNKIRVPLKIIKNIGSDLANKIVEIRGNIPFKDIFDFMVRCKKLNINKQSLLSLIDVGAFSSFGYNRKTLRNNLDSVIDYTKFYEFNNEIEKVELKYYPDYHSEEIMDIEHNLIGFYVSNHLATNYPNYFKQKDIVKYFDKNVTTVVYIERISRFTNKSGNKQAIIDASDETGMGVFTCFSEVVDMLEDIKEHDLVKITGKVRYYKADYNIAVTEIEKINN